MCGRFYIDPDDMSDEELIALIDREKAAAEASGGDLRLALGEVKPGDQAAVIALNRRLQRSAFVMKWGFRVQDRLLINARSETAAQKPTFRESMKMRRCLIPASAYFEWDHREKPYQKYRFQTHERKTIYLAGLYRFEDTTSLPVFTILTRDAAPDIACFHDRMPVIIPASLTDDWLSHQSNTNLILDHAVQAVEWQKAI